LIHNMEGIISKKLISDWIIKRIQICTRTGIDTYLLNVLLWSEGAAPWVKIKQVF